MREPASLDTKRLSLLSLVSPVILVLLVFLENLAHLIILTLRELEATACLWLTWLLTFNSTCITCDEALSTKCLLVFFVDFHECTSNSEAKCLALTRIATTCEVCLDVILLCNTAEVERLL